MFDKMFNSQTFGKIAVQMFGKCFDLSSIYMCLAKLGVNNPHSTSIVLLYN